MKTLAMLCLSLLVFAGFGARAQTPPDATPNLALEAFESGQWVTGTVYVLARDRKGRMLVGGHFDRAQGSITRTQLLRLNADGTIDAGFAPEFQSSTANEIHAIAFDGDAIYVGGLFESVGDEPAVSLVRLHEDGSVDTAWHSPFTSTSMNDVHALAVTASGLYVGGDLLDHDAFGLARLSRTDGAFDTSWVAQTQYNPTPTPIAGNRGEIDAIVAAGGDLYVGGQFWQIAGVERTGVARISQTNPVAVRAFDAGINGRAYALALSGSRLYVGGDFFREVEPAPSYLNRVDAATGALDASWMPTLNGLVDAIDIIAGTVYVGGYFQDAADGGIRIARIAASGDGETDLSWTPDASGGHVFAIADSCRGRLVVGGDYDTMSGAPRNGFAAFTVPHFDCLFADGFDPR